MRKLSVPIAIDPLNGNTVGEYIRQLKLVGAHRVFLCCWGSQFADTDEEITLRVKKCERYKPLFEKEGIEVGAWFNGFGHGGILSHETEKRCKDYQKLEGPTGKSAGDSFCPLDEEFVNDYLAFVKKAAAFHPDIIMIDDDYRLSVRDYGIGCFCPLHLKKFAEKLGEELPREELARRILTGKSSKYREAYRSIMGDTLLDFARKLRCAVDEIDPDIRLGAAMCYDVWDMEGTDGIELAKVLAGGTKPFLRTIGAPYWQEINGNGDVISAVEYTRMQAQWCKQYGIECTAEGDVYPRPRYNIPSSNLELYDFMLTASGDIDYNLKYMFDYTRKVDYETGYVDAHVRNTARREELRELFRGKQPSGVYIYESMKKTEHYDLSELPGAKPRTLDEGTFFGRAQYILAHNGIATNYSSEQGVVAAFGENARSLPPEYLDRGIITDCVGARILTERGFDAGYKSSCYKIFSREYFPEADDTIGFGSVVTCAMECDEKAEILSKYMPDGSVASYMYENGKGQRFFVLGYDSYATPMYIKLADYIVNYHRQKQLFEGIRWLGRKNPDAVVLKHPYLSSMTSRSADGKALSVGLFNGFRDPVHCCRVILDKAYSEIKFVNCKGKLEGDTVILEGEISSYGFAAFEVK